MEKSINMGLLMLFGINMGFINSDFPFINDAKMIYQLPYLHICILMGGGSFTAADGAFAFKAFTQGHRLLSFPGAWKAHNGTSALVSCIKLWCWTAVRSDHHDPSNRTAVA